MLLEQLRNDMKEAMKAHDSNKLGTIRFLLAEIRNAEIDKGEQTDDQIQNLIRKQIKQMQETNEQYVAGGRQDLIDENNAKITVLEGYVPAAMSSEELSAIVAEVVAANPGGQIGPIIGQVRAKTGGRADGGAIAAEVQKQLS